MTINEYELLPVAARWDFPVATEDPDRPGRFLYLNEKELINHLSDEIEDHHKMIKMKHAQKDTGVRGLVEVLIATAKIHPLTKTSFTAEIDTEFNIEDIFKRIFKKCDIHNTDYSNDIESRTFTIEFQEAVTRPLARVKDYLTKIMPSIYEVDTTQRIHHGNFTDAVLEDVLHEEEPVSIPYIPDEIIQ